MRLIGLIFTFLACCGAQARSFYATDYEARELLIAAIGAANEAAGCQWLEVASTPEEADVTVRTDDAYLNTFGAPHSGAESLGHYEKRTIAMRSPRAVEEDMRFETMLHEIGHSIGLAHEDGTVMRPDWYKATHAAYAQSLVNVASAHGLLRCPQ